MAPEPDWTSGPEAPARWREPRSPTVRVGFAGDLAPGLAGWRPIRKDPRLLELLRSCDFVVANLEGPLTDCSPAKDWGVVLRSAPASVAELAEMNVQAVSLANNHIMDCGPSGLDETRRVLAERGIGAFGAGRHGAQATAPLLRDSAAGPLAFLAYTVPFYDVRLVASPHTPGAAMLELDEARAQIASLRRTGHVVCVSVHGGHEYFRVPCVEHLAALRELARAGAHVVIGHHAHVFQGMEAREGSLIACSLGNLCFTWQQRGIHRGRGIGLTLAVELDRDGACACTTHFTLSHEGEPSLSLIEGEGDAALRRLLGEISGVLRDPAAHRRAWRRDCARMALALNVAAWPWPVRFARRAARVAWCLVRAGLSRGRRPPAARTPRHMSSPWQLLAGALRDLPSALVHWRDTWSCYRAYDEAGDEQGN